MYEAVEFASEGAVLRGRLYSNGNMAKPALVMAHGTSATITMVIDAYAEAFHAAGLNVLLYDNRNFGQSGGEPRQEINPWVQARGYRDAVAYLRAEHQVKRIALWGDSFTAGLVLVAGALIEDVTAIVAQIPVCGASWPEGPIEGDAFKILRAIFDSGDVSGGADDTTGPLPVVSLDQLNAPSLLTPPQAFRWFLEHGGQHGSGWKNRATRVIPKTEVPCSPLITAPYLTMPVQMITGKNDEMVHCNPELQDAVYERIAGPKEKLVLEGGHFGLLWKGSKVFRESVAGQTGFLTRVLTEPV